MPRKIFGSLVVLMGLYFLFSPALESFQNFVSDTLQFFGTRVILSVAAGAGLIFLGVLILTKPIKGLYGEKE